MTNLYYKQVVSGDENKKKQLKIRLELLDLVLDQIGSKTWNFFFPEHEKVRVMASARKTLTPIFSRVCNVCSRWELTEKKRKRSGCYKTLQSRKARLCLEMTKATKH